MIYFSNLPSTSKDMKKTKRSRMSCHNGNIPARQEFVLLDRKKYYFRIEKAHIESWGLMILNEINKKGRAV
jgi:hypothetical protein